MARAITDSRKVAITMATKVAWKAIAPECRARIMALHKEECKVATRTEKVTCKVVTSMVAVKAASECKVVRHKATMVTLAAMEAIAVAWVARVATVAAAPVVLRAPTMARAAQVATMA